MADPSSSVIVSNKLAPADRPSQITFQRPGQMALFANITTYPPLNQISIIPPSRQEFEFTVVIESSQQLPEQPWEVSIWYDHSTCYAINNGVWRALPLQKVDVAPTMLYNSKDSKTHRYTFEGQLPTPFPDKSKTYKGRKVLFTVKYRINPDAEWTWVWENFGVKDGELILQPPPDPNFMGAGPVELKDGWFTRKLNSESPQARLYSLESSVTIPHSGNDTKEETLVLGKVWSIHRWFALVRIWSPWLAPRHGDQNFHIAEPAILLSFLRGDGLHVVLLAANGTDDVLTTFKSDDQGNIVVAARNDTGKDRKFKVLAATAYAFEHANAAVMYEMRKLVRQSSAYQQVAQSLPTHIRADSVGSDEILITNMYNDRDPVSNPAPTPQWLASWYDSLAYCTWNSLGQDLNLEKILQGLKSLADHKINIATLIIDDNWQSLTGVQGETPQVHRGMTDFEANPKAFPEGLKAAVDKIRAANPRLRDIAVWHALMGYWGCISPDTGHIHKDYKLRQVTMSSGNAAGPKHIIDPSSIHKFYDDFYTFLSSAGITAVKTDVQFYLDLLADTQDRRDATISYQSAWTQAHLKHLAGKAISCMSQIPQILFHSFLPTNTPRVLLRNSDDFFPDIPSSHPWHIFANAHSALFVQHLNVLPDWDMFQTSHEYSGFHAAARCISGGPIYITDYPGAHNVDLIHQMTALNPRGDTVILRPSSVGKTISVYNSYQSGTVLKVGVYDGRAEVGTGLIGVFNVAEKETEFLMSITRIPGVSVNDPHNLPPDGKMRSWIVRSHMSCRISRPITPTLPVASSSLLQARLPIRGYDIWSALPVHGPYKLADGEINLAVVGLLGKMTGACALESSQFKLAGAGDLPEQLAADNATTRFKLTTTLKALGTLGIWFSSSKAISVSDNLLILLKGQVVPTERVSITTEGIDGGTSHGEQGLHVGLIEVDALGSWHDLNLDAGWSNEASVEVFIS